MSTPAERRDLALRARCAVKVAALNERIGAMGPLAPADFSDDYVFLTLAKTGFRDYLDPACGGDELRAMAQFLDRWEDALQW
jgi:hypothetical protein